MEDVCRVIVHFATEPNWYRGGGGGYVDVFNVLKSDKEKLFVAAKSPSAFITITENLRDHLYKSWAISAIREAEALNLEEHPVCAVKIEKAKAAAPGEENGGSND